MKTLLTLALCFCFYLGAANPVYQKLCEVNSCWNEQKDAIVPIAGANNEKEWIRLHLSAVEQTLRGRDIRHLSASQQINRLRSLDQLHQYWLAGNFPVNEDYTYRTPIFIDKHDNFCAVGYLVKESGHEEISRMIAAKTNLAYVREMNYPEIGAWASENGFTIDELAWIQPGYPPSASAAAVGRGTNGVVNEMLSDDSAGLLYVGGLFSTVDSTLPARNIAYITESGGSYTWHNMGLGVNGPVYAIEKFNNKIFVAGVFNEAGSVYASNIAYWDGAAWHDAGCIDGVVKDLITFNGELYACGRFDVCAALAEVNFAKWNGTTWQQIPGLTGMVNTMEAAGNHILLGGAFSYNNDTINAVAWSPSSSFLTFVNKVPNEVMDFQKFNDTFYAGCKWTNPNDSLTFLKLKNNSWVAGLTYDLPVGYSINTLCLDGNKLRVGGDIIYNPMMGTNISNAVNFSPPYIAGTDYMLLDSTVNNMVLFKGALFAGGAFKTGNGWSANQLNGIARQTGGTSVPSMTTNDLSIEIFPNPVAAGEQITIKNSFNATEFTLTDMNGRVVAKKVLNESIEQISLPGLASGTYIGEVQDRQGNKAVRKLVVE
jgi:hypothetical protein